MTKDLRPTVDNPDDDPYLWLEDIDGNASVDWVNKQNEDTLNLFGDSDYQKDQDLLTEIFDRKDQLPVIRRRGEYVYNYWRDAENPRGLWRRTTFDDFRKTAPCWEIVIDLDALAKLENEDWTWSGAVTLPGGHDRAMLHLSRGGGDARVLREFDMKAFTFIEDGFYLPEAKSYMEWLDKNTLLIASAYGEGMATESGYARTVRLWKRGKTIEEAEVLFETDPKHMAMWLDVDRTTGGEQLWFLEQTGFFNTRCWMGDRSGRKQCLDLPSDAMIDCAHGWLIIRLRYAWIVGGQTYPPDCVLTMPLQEFLDGKRDFQIIFEAKDRRYLQHFFWAGSSLVLSILDNLAPVFEYWSPSESGWKKIWVPEIEKISMADMWALDSDVEESNGDVIAMIQTPLSPPTLKLAKAGEGLEQLKQAPAVFDATGLVMNRYEAVSIDGEKIPYFEIGPEQRQENAPVHMTAYGGFGASELPIYKQSIGKLWLERGGISVVANIRGGGEFGSPWHDAGRYAGKALTHDDFAAVAKDLVRRGVTRSDRIAAEGGSNGGILITNMLTRYPECFGALFCTIPLVDMRRYTKLLAGSSWIEEYGDPDKPEDWAFLQTYSAYHNVKPDQTYPPILLATTRRDDRVHPGHARKMAAKLQAIGYSARFYELETGGHSYGKNNRERAGFIALGFNFLRKSIGWVEGGDFES